MRKIKFRAWDKKYKIMLNDVTTGTITIYDKGNQSDSKDCVFMQHTGLQDKTGRDIFEGDIVNVYGSIISGPNHNKKIIFTDVCKWKDDECKYIFKIRERDFGCEHSWGNDYEIIGNIYENPELLDK